jgi:DNA-binding MarR family transcriptional regulator
MNPAPATARADAIEELRRTLGELLGAERRLRGRDRRGPSGLTFPEVRALMALDREEDATATAGALAKAADLNPASITALLDSLEERGIATRTRAEHDRRCVVVSLTESGREEVRAARARWQGKLDAALGDLSEEELAAGTAVLHRLAGLFEEMGRPDEEPQGR